MVAVELVEIRVLAEVDIAYFCLAYIEYIKLGIPGDIKFLDGSGVNGKLSQLGATGRIEVSQSFVRPCVK